MRREVREDTLDHTFLVNTVALTRDYQPVANNPFALFNPILWYVA
jgi:hypothetical protein